MAKAGLSGLIEYLNHFKETTVDSVFRFNFTCNLKITLVILKKEKIYESTYYISASTIKQLHFTTTQTK